MIDILIKIIVSIYGCDVYYDDNKNNDNNFILIKIRVVVCFNDINIFVGFKM